nr:BrxE family protein [Neobacillus sp. Marseille-Q6967]
MLQRDKINLLILRVCVGYLGELQQHKWWTSSFYSNTSTAFLIHVFGKTSPMTQYYGVRSAAAIIHDEVIGIGEGVFHLFRLPEVIEREFHELLNESTIVERLNNYTQNTEVAMDYLESISGKSKDNTIGPIRIGKTDDIENASTWSNAAQYYLRAFKEGTKIFPYVTEGK